MVNNFFRHICVETPKATLVGIINTMTDLHVIGKETLKKEKKKDF